MDSVKNHYYKRKVRQHDRYFPPSYRSGDTLSSRRGETYFRGGELHDYRISDHWRPDSYLNDFSSGGRDLPSRDRCTCHECRSSSRKRRDDYFDDDQDSTSRTPPRRSHPTRERSFSPRRYEGNTSRPRFRLRSPSSSRGKWSPRRYQRTLLIYDSTSSRDIDRVLGQPLDNAINRYSSPDINRLLAQPLKPKNLNKVNSKDCCQNNNLPPHVLHSDLPENHDSAEYTHGNSMPQENPEVWKRPNMNDLKEFIGEANLLEREVRRKKKDTGNKFHKENFRIVNGENGKRK